MTPATLYNGQYGIVVHFRHAEFSVSTVRQCPLPSQDAIQRYFKTTRVVKMNRPDRTQWGTGARFAKTGARPVWLQTPIARLL